MKKIIGVSLLVLAFTATAQYVQVQTQPVYQYSQPTYINPQPIINQTYYAPTVQPQIQNTTVVVRPHRWGYRYYNPYFNFGYFNGSYRRGWGFYYGGCGYGRPSFNIHYEKHKHKHYHDHWKPRYNGYRQRRW